MKKILTNDVFLIVVVIIGLLAYQWYKAPKYSKGNVAPNFTSITPNGDEMSLSDFKGKYVLLDFWGSWCGPCRAENPSIVELYTKYKDAKFKNADGFTVFSVGMETNKDRWIAAIQQDNLYWENHVSEVKRLKSEVALQYKVREIPTKYLIHPEGYIIGVNMDFEEMDKLLSEQVQ
jgi:thiol-disulfide isomerase/thioredoxin